VGAQRYHHLASAKIQLARFHGKTRRCVHLLAERRCFAVRGTPTDCIIMGARHLLTGKGPDLVLSTPRDVLINVNFPDCPPEEVKRIVVTAQGRRGRERSQIDARQDGRGKPYYWITYRPRVAVKASEATDLAVLDGGCSTSARIGQNQWNEERRISGSS
jgi:broad specificity polyphosphatase/5'/3'-nucleotidase SurE